MRALELRTVTRVREDGRDGLRDGLRRVAGRRSSLGGRNEGILRTEWPLRGPGGGIETECLNGCDKVGFRSQRHAYDESGVGGSGGGREGASRMTTVTMPPTRGAFRGENSTRS